MKYWLILLFCLGIASTCPAADESVEPPLKYTLTVGDKKTEVMLDKPVRLEGTFKNPEVTLTAAPTRTFTYGGVEFQYPSNFTWEAEIEDDGTRTWTLSGTAFVIFLFVLPVKMDAVTYLHTVALQFEGADHQFSDVKRKFGSLACAGKRLKISIAGNWITQEAFVLPTATGSRLLVFQDFPTAKGDSSPEGKIVLDLLEKNFRNTQPVPAKKSGEKTSSEADSTSDASDADKTKPEPAGDAAETNAKKPAPKTEADNKPKAEPEAKK